MLGRVYEYVKDKEFRFTVYHNRVHIINYKKIVSLKNDNISVVGDFSINIYGENLVLNKLLDDELLIVGKVLRVEVIND